MAKIAIEEIDSVRSGERNAYFAGLKGFVLSFIKEGIPSVLIGAAAGAAIAGVAMLGIEAGQLMNWLGPTEIVTSTVGFIGSVAAASGVLSGALVGVKGAYQEVSHARTVNNLINQEINNIKSRANTRSRTVEVAGPAPETPDYVKKILDAGEQAHPKTQLSKLMKEREDATLSQNQVTLH